MSIDATVNDRSTVEHTRSGAVYRPEVDILELADELLVHADMPGAKGEDIDIQFEDGSLTIHARVVPRSIESSTTLLHEYGVGDFYRTFRVSEQIDASRIAAQFREGVLTLHLPKAEMAKPRKIHVQGQASA